LPEQAVTAAPPPAVRAASEYDYPPYCIVKTNGTACGFSVELLRAALKAVHREVTFETGSWSEVMQMLLDGQVDVLPLVGYTPERKERFDFTMPYLNVHGTLVVRNDQLDIQSLDDLSGKRVAVMRGDNAEEFVRRINLDCNISLTETSVFPADSTTPS
jgi:two-component system sensor histidine kinase EvgS